MVLIGRGPVTSWRLLATQHRPVCVWPGNDAVNEPPEVLIVVSVARSSFAEVRNRWNVAGTLPPVMLNTWFTDEVPVLTASSYAYPERDEMDDVSISPIVETSSESNREDEPAMCTCMNREDRRTEEFGGEAPWIKDDEGPEAFPAMRNFGIELVALDADAGHDQAEIQRKMGVAPDMEPQCLAMTADQSFRRGGGDDKRQPGEWGLRVKPCVVDWDHDGRLDLLLGDRCGSLLSSFAEIGPAAAPANGKRLMPGCITTTWPDVTEWAASSTPTLASAIERPTPPLYE